MATREIRWTVRAIQDKLSIYEYWINRNKSTQYPEKLERPFNKTMKIAATYPKAGIKTEMENVRIRIVREF